MSKIAVATALALVLIDAAFGQALTDRVKIDVTRADLQAMGQGIMKLPYETAAPLLVELQKQLEAQTPKAEAPPPVSKPEEKSAAAAKK